MINKIFQLLFNISKYSNSIQHLVSKFQRNSSSFPQFCVDLSGKMTSTGFSMPSTTTAPSLTALTAPSQSVPSTTTNLQTSATLPLNQNQMNFYNLEEQINKYTLELAEQEKIFMNQATCGKIIFCKNYFQISYFYHL